MVALGPPWRTWSTFYEPGGAQRFESFRGRHFLVTVSDSTDKAHPLAPLRGACAARPWNGAAGRIVRHAMPTPTIPPPPPRSLNSSLLRNIDALQRRRKEEEASAGVQERFASLITGFTGSMRFVYLHAAIYGFWIAANLGVVPGLEPWDPSFVVLAMVASVEAIFLSTFILITQNRMASAADRRAELDVQISLLAEHEITKLVQLVSEMAERLGVPHEEQEVDELKRDVAPEAVLDAIEESERQAEANGPPVKL